MDKVSIQYPYLPKYFKKTVPGTQRIQAIESITPGLLCVVRGIIWAMTVNHKGLGLPKVEKKVLFVQF